MKKDVAEKWVAALRSGEYKQGRGTLRKELSLGTTTRHCCLGVLCEVVDPENVLHWHNHNELTRSIKALTGMRREDGALTTRLEGHDTLVDVNDILELPFPQIADYIEAHWEEL